MDSLGYLLITVGFGLSAWVTIKQKSYWALTLKEKRKRFPLIISGVLSVVLGIIILLIAP